MAFELIRLAGRMCSYPRSEPRTEVRVFSDMEKLSYGAAEHIMELAHRVVEKRGRFSLVLSGGSTPRRLYELLGTSFYHHMPWTKTLLFWGDECYVPRFHPASNYGMAHETFLQSLPISIGQVHRIPTEVESTARAAYVYDQIIHLFLRESESELFDLVLLGLGTDGHTASIFPEHLNDVSIGQSSGHPSSNSEEPSAKAGTAPERHAPAERITLTLDTLNKWPTASIPI